MPTYFTKRGLQAKETQIRDQELKLRTIGKEAGEEAGMNCDWHDNFGFEDARRRLEMESTTLARMKQDLSDAQLVDIEEQSQKVMLGVTVSFSIDGETRQLTIGAFGESDPTKGLIAYTSPIGRALISMKVGDSKRTKIGDKSVVVEVDEILPPSQRYYNLIQKFYESTASPHISD